MFDFHMHSRVSFDGRETSEAMAKAALAAGLKEICFTDHLDYDPLEKWELWLLTPRFTMRNTTIWRFPV